MLKFTTLASGSGGNAAVISCGQTHILLDAGISARRITTGLKELGIEAAQLRAVLVTHDHSDHICGMPGFRWIWGMFGWSPSPLPTTPRAA